MTTCSHCCDCGAKPILGDLQLFCPTCKKFIARAQYKKLEDVFYTWNSKQKNRSNYLKCKKNKVENVSYPKNKRGLSDVQAKRRNRVRKVMKKYDKENCSVSVL